MTEESKHIKEKFDLLNRLLDDEYVMINLDPNAAGVIIPSHLYKDDNVTLKLSRLFRGGVELNENAVIANLSFNQRYTMCTIPLAAIWGIISINNENTMWPESTPLKYLQTIIAQQISPAAEKEPEKPKSKPARPSLKRIK